MKTNNEFIILNFPAYAGMNRIDAEKQILNRIISRSCGDKKNIFE